MTQHNNTTTQTKVSSWQGSLKTALLIRNQIAERWGEAEAENYDPTQNCFTFNTWRAKGYKVKKGEKALRSYTLIGGKSSEDDEEAETEKHLKGVCLFYILQVEPMKGKEA